MTSILYNNPFDKAEEYYQRCSKLIISNPFSKEFASDFRALNEAIIECSCKISFDHLTSNIQKEKVAYWDKKAADMTLFIQKLSKLAEEVDWKFVEYKM